MTIELQMSASIVKIKKPTTKQFLEIWKQHQPFVIEDVANHWNFLNIVPPYLSYAISSGKIKELMGFLKTMFH